MRRWFPLFGNIEVQLPLLLPAKPRETDKDTETAKNLSSNLLLVDLFNKINNLRKLKAKRKLPISEASLVRMVRQAGFEPTTPWFVARYSIQLSYWRTSDFSFVSVALRGEECVFYERKIKMQVFF